MRNPRPQPSAPLSIDGETYLSFREAERIIGLPSHTLDRWVTLWNRDGENPNNPDFEFRVRHEGRHWLMAESQVRTLAQLAKTHKLRWNGIQSLLTPEQIEQRERKWQEILDATPEPRILGLRYMLPKPTTAQPA